MSINFYKYRKVKHFTPAENDVFCGKVLYSFKSPKTKQWYWVWVEEYPNNMYAVKFHLKADRNSKQKYHRLTGLNEVRPVLNTCVEIMLSIYKSNEKASFGFVGSNLPDEDENETKRFRVYRTIMATYFSNQYFAHIEIVEKSAYMLICREELEHNPQLISQIETFFADNYNYFD